MSHRREHDTSPEAGTTVNHSTILQIEQTFPTWAFSAVDRLRKALGLGAVLAAAWSIKNLQPFRWIGADEAELRSILLVHKHDRALLALIQALACLVLAWLTPRAKSLSTQDVLRKSDIDAAAHACRRIQMVVICTFTAWSLYYLVTGISLLQDSAGNFDRVVMLTLNTLQGLLLFWLYLELAELTVETDKTIKRAGVSNSEKGTHDAAFHRTLSLGIFALIIGPVWYAYGRGADGVIKLFDTISSCLNGVSLALVVGRFGSKSIDPGPVVLGLLYFYAVIQPMAASFQDYPAVQLVATTVAFPLKVLLWLVCVWAFTTGILAEYVHSIRAWLIEGRTPVVEEQTAD